MEKIEIGDFLLIAEAVTGIDARVLARNPRTMTQAEMALAAPFAGFGDLDLYPSLAEKAGVHASRIIRYHPLVDGNKRSARVVMREFLARNGHEIWRPPEGGWQEEAEMIERLAADTIEEREFIAWVAQRTRQRPPFAG